MLIFISFLLVMAGCVNWLMVGLLQYDFVAGIFGYQGSIFSRIIYIVIGAGALFFLFKTIVQKGKIEVFNFKKKSKEPKQEMAGNVEASREHHRHTGGYHSDDGHRNFPPHQEYDDFGENSLENKHFEREEYDSLFDEHFHHDRWICLIFLCINANISVMIGGNNGYTGNSWRIGT